MSWLYQVILTHWQICITQFEIKLLIKKNILKCRNLAEFQSKGSSIFLSMLVCCLFTLCWDLCIKDAAKHRSVPSQRAECIKTAILLTEAVRVEWLMLTRFPVVHIRVFILILVRIVRWVCGPKGTGGGVRHVSHGGEWIGSRQLLLCVYDNFTKFILTKLLYLSFILSYLYMEDTEKCMFGLFTCNNATKIYIKRNISHLNCTKLDHWPTGTK